jgi:serine protease Do
MSRRATKRLAVAAAVAAVLAGGYLTEARAMAAPTAGGAPGAPPSPPAAAAPAPAALPDFSAIVRRYGPAVVNVSTTGTVKTGGVETPFGPVEPDDPLFPFFRRFGAPGGGGRMLTRGLGSGFVVAPEGVILTNAHVVADASEVRVKLTDKREFPAKVLGIDRTTDVAVLKIDAKDLPTVRVGERARPEVGQWVLAIGSPFGFENSATAGIVSGESRSLPGEGYVPFLQTDVAVNPGNSGGPLFDTAGEVVGINSQIYSRSGGYMGLSFAIPIDVAMKVEQQIVARGKVTRGWLGIAVQDVDQALAESFHLPRPEGALVSAVQDGSPAGRAGLQPGDVILSLDGRDVAASSDLPPRVADLAPGSTARLQVWRGRRRQDLEVKVAEAKDATVARSAERQGEGGRLGLAVRPLTPDEREEVGAKGGVVVEGVQGAAARAGIQPGDVVLAVNGTEISSVEQLRGVVAHADKRVALLVERGRARIFVPVELG